MAVCAYNSIGEIKLEDLFGKDAKRLEKACDNIMDNWLYKYKGCYRANYPSLSEVWKTTDIPKGSSLAKVWKQAIKDWYEDHPGEKEKVENSRREWEENRDRQFRIVYGIAKRHGLYLDWCGNGSVSCGDRWIIIKDHKEIAKLQCY